MASDGEDLFEEDGALGAHDDDLYDETEDNLAASLEDLGEPEGLKLAERPLTAAERDRRTDAVTGGGQTALKPFEVEVKGEICATAKMLDSKVQNGYLTLSTKDNTIDPTHLRYSNAEDASEAMHKFGNYQLLQSVQLDYFEHPYGRHIAMMLTLPFIKAGARDRFERAIETRSTDAPYGVFAKTIMPTDKPMTILNREIEQGTIDFCTAYPGHTVESMRKTFMISPTNDYAAIQLEPLMSPVVPYYNMLAKPLGKPTVEAATAAKLATKWQSADPELTKKASELCEKVMQEKLPFTNVTNPDNFRILLQPYERRFDEARNLQTSQPISFTALSQQRLSANPAAMKLEMQALTGTSSHKAKYEAFKKKGETFAKTIRIGLTFKYYAFQPQHQ